MTLNSLTSAVLPAPCKDAGWLVPSWPPVPLCLFLPLTVELIREQGLRAAPSCSTELGEERVGETRSCQGTPGLFFLPIPLPWHPESPACSTCGHHWLSPNGSLSGCPRIPARGRALPQAKCEGERLSYLLSRREKTWLQLPHWA